MILPSPRPCRNSNIGATPFSSSNRRHTEAFAAGFPAIVSDLRQIAEVIRANGCGLVAPAISIPAWSDAIKSVAANRNQLRLWKTKSPALFEEAFFYDQIYRTNAAVHRCLIAQPACLEACKTLWDITKNFAVFTSARCPSQAVAAVSSMGMRESLSIGEVSKRRHSRASRMKGFTPFRIGSCC